MKGHEFKGWSHIFAFTMNQNNKSKGFKVTTILIACILFFIMLITNVIMASNYEEADTMNITDVYVRNNTDIKLDYEMLKQVANGAYSKVFVTTLNDITVDELILQNKVPLTTFAFIEINKLGEGYNIVLSLPNNSSISKEIGNEFLNEFISCFQLNKMLGIGLNESQLNILNTPILTEYETVGEEKESIGVIIIKMLAPMLFAMVFYFMVLLYGQSICKHVVAEKSSRLMELLLTSVPPEAIISGKVVSMTLVAILQFLSWIVAAISGFFIGDFIASRINPNFVNPIFEFIKVIRSTMEGSAFSPVSLLLAIVFICFGLLFYTVLASMVGSTFTKAEELSTGIWLYQIPVVVSWLLAYFLPLRGDGFMRNLIRYIPFTAPFITPAEIFIGAMSLYEGLIALSIMIVFICIFIVLTGKIYKGFILFQGNKVGFKTLVQILKTK